MSKEREEIRDAIAIEPESVIAIIRRITGSLIKSLSRIRKHIENRKKRKTKTKGISKLTFIPVKTVAK